MGRDGSKSRRSTPDIGAEPDAFDADRTSEHETLGLTRSELQAWLEMPGRSPGAPTSAGAAAGGRFRLLRVIGAGGHGVVFEAFDSVRQAPVALKTLKYADPSGIYLLKNEFRSLVDLSHPNLVRLHDLFASEQRWCFSMDIIEGQHFDEYVRPGGMLDEARLRAALPQLFAGLDAIHRAGKLHRDLKPSNVLVSADGHLTLLDFGLVVGVGPDDPGQTLAKDRSSGTPAYMAPEQAKGEKPRFENDLYAIGVMLFEALTGQLPLDGEVHEVLVAKQWRDAPSALDIAPGCPPDLAALAARLLSRDPSARSLHGTEFAPPQRPVEPAGVTAPEGLLGRERELSLLMQAYAQIPQGRCSVALVQGDSGVGKSSLCAAFAELLTSQTDAIVLSSRCYEHESVPFNAFDPLLDAVTRYIRQLSPAEGAAHLPRDTFALARMFPVLGRVSQVRDAPERKFADEQDLRRRAFAAFAELLARWSDRRPVVLSLDDLQWMDGDSATLLQYLLKQPPAPLTWVLSHRREGEVNPHLRSTLAAVRNSSSHRVFHVGLRTLEAEATTRLVRHLLVDDAQLGNEERIERIALESDGNPFLARELAGYARRHGDRELSAMTLGALVDAHFGELGQGARRLLETLALAARPLPVEVACAAAECDHRDLDQLRTAHLLRGGAGEGGFEGHGIECCHDRIREAVFAAIPSERRHQCYGALAGALQSVEAPMPELIARALEGAGDFERASEYAERAADLASKNVAFEQAAEFYARALKLSPERAPFALTLSMSEALAKAGSGAQAAEGYQRAAAMVEGSQRLELLRRAGEELLKTGHVVEGTALLQGACREMGMRLPLGVAEAAASVVWSEARLRVRGLALSPRASMDDPRLEMAQTAVSGLIGYLPVQTAGLAGRYLLLALDLGDAAHAVRALGFTALVQSQIRPRSGIPQRYLERMEQLIEAQADAELATFGHVMKGVVAYTLKRFPEARGHLGHALGTLRRSPGSKWYSDVAHVFDQASAFASGEFGDIVDHTPPLVDDAFRRGRLWAGVMLSGIHGAPAWLAPDDPEAYRAQLGEARERWSVSQSHKWPDLMLLLGELALALYEGRPQQGMRVLEAERPAYRLSILTMRNGSAAQGLAIYGGGCAASALRDAKALPEHERQACEQQLERAIRELRGAKIGSLRGVADGLEAAKALQRGDRAGACTLLRSAVRGREQTGLGMYGAAAQRRLGQLLGGDEGDEMRRLAEDFMRAKRVKNLEAMSELLCPGCRPLPG